MNRFAFTSIVFATFALAACGDDSTGTGGGGGATASSSGDTTSTASSSPTSSSSSSKAASSSSGSEGTGGDPTGTGGSPAGTGGDDTGTGGTGSGTGGTGAGTGGGSGACAAECATNPEDLDGLSEECQSCAEDHVGAGDCQAEFLACLGAEAADTDTEGCTTCSEIANTGSLEGLCESNVDEATTALACICGADVCG